MFGQENPLFDRFVNRSSARNLIKSALVNTQIFHTYWVTTIVTTDNTTVEVRILFAGPHKRSRHIFSATVRKYALARASECESAHVQHKIYLS